MMIRKVVTRRSRHVRVVMPSIKNNCRIECESQVEQGYFRLLELAGTVRRYRVQPMVARILVEDREVFYFPDVEIDFVDGTRAIVEVKPEAELKKHKVAAKMAAAKAHFDRLDIPFHVVTDTWVRRNPRFDNVDLLMYHRRRLISPQEQEAFMTLLKDRRPETVGDLIDLVGEQNAYLALGLGLVGIDLDDPLSDTSSIFMNGGHRCAAVFH